MFYFFICRLTCVSVWLHILPHVLAHISFVQCASVNVTGDVLVVQSRLYELYAGDNMKYSSIHFYSYC